MPPKKKAAESKGEETGLDGLDTDFSVSSPLSAASTASVATSMVMTTDQLQLVLETVLGRLSSSSGVAGPSAPPPAPKPPTIPVPKWSGEETPWDYFSKYEQAQKHNGVSKADWGPLLQVYLAGKAQAAYVQVDPTKLADYDLVKETMLRALWDTPEDADRTWWTLRRRKGEVIGAFYLRMRATAIRRFFGISTREAMFDKVLLSRFMALLPSECYEKISARNPKTAEEAAGMVADLEGRESFSRHYLAGDTASSHHPRHHFKREQNGFPNKVQGDSGGPKPVVGQQGSNGIPSSAPSSNNFNNLSGGQNFQEKGIKQEKVEKKGRGPIVCYCCGEPGHIRPNCPNKIRRVRSPECAELMSVDGLIEGVAVSGLRVDTGADRTIVRKDLVPELAYTGREVVLDTWKGAQPSKHKLANVSIQVGDVTVSRNVAVAENLEYPALLGADLGKPLFVEAMSKIFGNWEEEKDSAVVEEEKVEAVRATRAQVKKQVEEEVADDLASAQAECKPLPLAEVFDFPDSYFEDDCVVTPVEECVTLPGLSSVHIPLPDLSGESGRASLIVEQQGDPSLERLMGLAEKRERGYAFDEGVLVHYTEDELADPYTRLVVPKGRRQRVLELGHCNLLAGHFGVKKTFAKIAKSFVWPKMWIEVKAFVKSCAGCQRAARNNMAKAPLHPLPVVSEPFSKVAIDIVGPLPRSTSGYKYLLTFMCLYTKYPEAIPLKRVDNITVLEGFIEVFSRHGFPREILTDQGSVFMSRLTAQCCETFGVKKVRTSPYHPQSDGALERWHACLKGMFRRSGEDLKSWDSLLKFVLFAYRDTPHIVTGYSPFTLMFGREVRGPLALLRSSWAEDSEDPCDVGEWLVNVKARMSEMSELVSMREVKAKSKMKEYYDKTASVKEFVSGDMVLVRKPILRGKLCPTWEGPYEIEQQKSPVTYLVKVPGRPSKSKVLHCNLLKKWTTPMERIHRVMVLREEESAETPPSGLILSREDFVPSAAELKQLEEVLTQFPDVLCSKPGLTDKISMAIRTGDSEPVRSHPYRIPPKWKEEVKEQLDTFLSLGIIRPSESPWSSSVVTVQKKEGGVRLCIDFRAVNNVTQPDPYLMPLIDEILDSLATAKFISKIDLTKGFHQIPIAEVDIPKTAFCTPWGKFEFLVMPFGLRNGPALFQRLMDGVLHQDKDICQVYIDDIAVHSQSWSEHCAHIARVLVRLRGAGLTANVSKCQWGQTSCVFLGHVIGRGLVSPADLKIKAVREFPLPKTKKAVRQFLGLTGYYRRFIAQYAEHTFELTEATKKSAPDCVILSELLLAECSYLKDMLCSLPSLTLPVPEDQFLLQTDASGVGIGAVLSVVRGEKELPVAFFSKKLQPRERKFSGSELERLAVVLSVTHFDAYLITHPFILETDHRALVYLMTADHKNGRLARWAMRLQPYTFSIRYKPGSQNCNADVLSRGFSEEKDSTLPLQTEKGGGGGDVRRTLPSSSPPNMSSRGRTTAEAEPLIEN